MNLVLRKSIRQVLLAGGASAFAIGVIGSATAALGVQYPPPGPGKVPDYFGVVSNYATSPQPLFSKVTIAAPAAGTQAIAAATTYDYVNNIYLDGIADIQLITPGSGYDVANPPLVTVTGAATAGGVVATAHVNGVIGINLSNAGSGYSVAPDVQISAPDVAGGIQATATATIDNLGAVTAVTITNPGSGYTLPPTVSFDTAGNPVLAGFTDAAADATVNETLGVITSVTVDQPGAGFSQPIAGSGIRKFVDSMPSLNQANNLGQSLPVAIANQGVTPADNSEYYVIAEVAYTRKLHSDLPPSHLRGYVQVFPDGTLNQFTLAGYNAAADKTVYANQYAQYLGPVIVANKNKPVRVKLVNLLPTGAAGELPFPTDRSYMGAEEVNALGVATNNTDNRTAMHLHGGNTPWISDGLPRQWLKPAGESGAARGETARDVPDMWFDNAGNLIASCTGQTACGVPGASNNPGAGALTFYYTNQQSARLMFYHDHAEGITRLNVYDGLAAGYLLTDPTEQAMSSPTGGTVTERGVTTTYQQVLPEDQIPLVIQEKTFVPDDTTPVINFYGPFRSQLEAQDSTWRWGSYRKDKDTGIQYGQYAADASVGLNGTGDLWVPHVYMTNQNPGDPTGANALGRWDYGPWFWPPFANINQGAMVNPYYDPNCNTLTGVGVSPLSGTCEPQMIPGVPNGASDVYPASDLHRQPAGTPEAFNDTPLVNGTVYPYYDVDPKKYRLRILSAGNDRLFNLSLVVASSKNVDTTATANFGNLATSHPDALTGTCDGHNGAPTPDLCTEVRMVPFSAAQNNPTTNPSLTAGYLQNQNGTFPSWWYTFQKVGVVLDGRPSGVFDPKVRGPALVQVGTEAGFLASPAIVRNQPVNFEYNVKNIVVGNIKEHALLLGPAERADVVVDFSQFAGSTLILYNDAPAPTPAIDLRLDYYTGNFDNTDTGGTFSTIPGYGPNSRTLMQFRVRANCTTANCGTGINRAISANHPVDDYDAAHFAKLTSEVRTAFKTSQEPIIVPQEVHNAAYGTAVVNTTTANLSGIADTQLSYQPLTLSALDQPTGALDPATTLIMQPKSIIENFTKDFGRMNAMLGVEVPNTTGLNQTSVPYGYVDAATELVKISEFGQPISGTLADGTQLWKITHNGVDTHPIHFHLFHVQLINRVGWDGAIRNPDANESGWKEVVRMNPLEDVIVALRPKTIDNLPFKLANSHRALDPSNPNAAMNLNMAMNLDPTSGNASNEVNQVPVNFGWEYVWHCHILGHEENDMMRAIAVAAKPETPAGVSVATSTPNADGLTNSNVLNWTDASMVSNWVEVERASDPAFTSNVVNRKLLFRDLYVANAAVALVADKATECPSQAGCAMSYTDPDAPLGSVYYRVRANNMVGAGEGIQEKGYTAAGAYKATLTSEGNANLKALLPNGGFTGFANATAASAWSNVAQQNPQPLASLSTAALSFGNLNFDPAGTLTGSATQTVTVKNNGQAPLVVGNVATATGAFTVASQTCTAAAVNVGASCTINVTFKPTAVGPFNDVLTITDNSNGVVNATQTVSLTGAGVPLVTPTADLNLLSLNFADTVGGMRTAAKVVTLTNNGNGPLSIASMAIVEKTTSGTAITPVDFAQSNKCGTTLAAGKSCKISVSFAPKHLGALSASLVVTDNAGGIVGSQQSVALTGNGITKLLKATWSTGLQADLASYAGNNVNSSTVQLNFTDNSSYEAGYAVAFCNGTCSTVLASYNAPVAYVAGATPANNTWYVLPAAQVLNRAPLGSGVANVVATLPLNQNAGRYFFRIAPTDPLAAAGVVDWVNLGSVASSALLTEPGSVVGVTAQVGGYKATAGVGGGTLSIGNWANAANNTVYNVELRNNTTAVVSTYTVPGNVTSWNFSGIPAGTYRVRINQRSPSGASSGWAIMTAGVTVN